MASKPSNSWHLHIHQDHIVRLPLESVDGFKSVAGDVRTITQPIKNPDGDFLIDDIVLSKQYA